MPSQIATRAAERCRKRVVLGGSETFESIIDAELAPVREALAEALSVSESTEGGGYRMINQPLRAALAALEVKNA